MFEYDEPRDAFPGVSIRGFATRTSCGMPGRLWETMIILYHIHINVHRIPIGDAEFGGGLIKQERTPTWKLKNLTSSLLARVRQGLPLLSMPNDWV